MYSDEIQNLTGYFLNYEKTDQEHPTPYQPAY